MYNPVFYNTMFAFYLIIIFINIPINYLLSFINTIDCFITHSLYHHIVLIFFILETKIISIFPSFYELPYILFIV